MSDERRRYFRINEMIGISYDRIDNHDSSSGQDEYPPNLLELASLQDEKIEDLLLSLEDSNPKVAELLGLINQKLERLTSYLNVESPLIKRIANRVREANLSACGIAFNNHEFLPEGSRIRLELTLYPSQDTIFTDGMVVGIDQQGNDSGYYCRIDFYGMKMSTQERLIQYIVQSQSAQLKSSRVKK